MIFLPGDRLKKCFRAQKVPGPAMLGQLGKSCRIVKDREKAERLCGKTSAKGLFDGECFSAITCPK
jgi:hypothetical protein